MATARPAVSLAPLAGNEALQAWLARAPVALDPATAWWLSGYFAALAGGPATPRAVAAAPAVPDAAEANRLTVLYGTQSGNARRIAEQFFADAEAAGIRARIVRADAYAFAELGRETRLALVISTQGDGDPPDDARAFVAQLMGRRAPRLDGLSFAVLGLGDSSYPKFCAAARALDARLAELGATRLLPLAEADVDVDAVAGPWQGRLLQAMAAQRPALQLLPGGAAASREPAAVPASRAATRESPAEAELVERVRLTARDSDRDVHHLAFAIDPARLDYEPGDAAGVWPVQAPTLVDAVLEAAGQGGERLVSVDGETQSLRVWLTERRELTRVTPRLIEAQAARSGRAQLTAALADPAERARLVESLSLLDLLELAPAAWEAEALVRALPPLAPRLYSIASSRAEVGDELHLTVAHRVDPRRPTLRHGVASHHLATLDPGGMARLYIARNERFRLPRDGDRDLIMIGPGTGVAPFRAFVQQRAAAGARGRHWLFFGARRFRSDFLYQTEWQRALADGRLTRLSLAFSRDGDAKAYVQDRMREGGAELWDWIAKGAYVYVCGDARRMARDVDDCLRRIACEHGGLDEEGAAEFMHELEREGRYARDVY